MLQMVGKAEPTFSSFNAILKKLLWLVGSVTGRNVFDIFFITVQEHFCVWLKALNNEVSKDLTQNSNILVSWLL